LLAVTLYDHLCTLPQEMKLIWGREFNSVILLFHVNRWANTLYAVVYFMMLSCFDLMTIATRFSVIAFDFIVLLIIWSNTLDTRKNAAHNGIKTPLATMLVRDGRHL
ncbi:hypothetical protein OBBRIDRAFT_734340, partial [Obba rivulosa]